MTALDPFVAAREQFLGLVSTIRPELHRYCARLTGSVIDGEDIVQDTLAKAFYALTLEPEMPPLRPWLFRIAHNAAIDYLRSHGKKLTDPSDDIEIEGDVPADPATMRAAIAKFVALPVGQRSAVILKDVLGFSVEEVAETTGSTVPAVKAALVRGRTALAATDEEVLGADVEAKRQLDRYAQLFNARDWDGVRALVAEECRLDLVSKSQRRGKAVKMYFTNYEKLDIRLRSIVLEGRPALAAYVGDATVPSHFILLDFEGGKVAMIRDFKYVPYLVAEADYVSDMPPSTANT
ncbi:MAG: sigma-70 family RNA polymerase sigma factor [Kofleriaceae bacterium]